MQDHCPFCRHHAFTEKTLAGQPFRTCMRCSVSWQDPEPEILQAALPLQIRPAPIPPELVERIPPPLARMWERIDGLRDKLQIRGPFAKSDPVLETHDDEASFLCARAGEVQLRIHTQNGSARHLFLAHVFLTAAEGRLEGIPGETCSRWQETAQTAARQPGYWEGRPHALSLDL